MAAVSDIIIDSLTETLTKLLVEGATLAKKSKAIKINRIQKYKTAKKQRIQYPKWHDLSCEEAQRKVSASAKLLKNNPKDQSLRAKLRHDLKDYNKLVKLRNKQFVENMFLELDSMENNNPRGYMDLVKAMRDGTFDKQTTDDTSGVSPSKWHAHFSNLLAKEVDNDNYLQQYISEYFWRGKKNPTVDFKVKKSSVSDIFRTYEEFIIRLCL